jgi:hypothetical protein
MSKKVLLAAPVAGGVGRRERQRGPGVTNAGADSAGIGLVESGYLSLCEPDSPAGSGAWHTTHAAATPPVDLERMRTVGNAPVGESPDVDEGDLRQRVREP